MCKEEARYYLLHENNVSKFHSIFENRVLNVITKDEEVWMDYANLVRYYEKNTEKTREIYENACGKCQHNTYPFKLFEAWKNFEREEGNFVKKRNYFNLLFFNLFLIYLLFFKNKFLGTIFKM